jgi:hypothetical protein
MHLISKLALFTGVLTTAMGQPSSECLTPQGVHCRTIKWEVSGWANLSWGFLDIERWHGTTTMAYRKDGSSLETSAQEMFKRYVVPADNFSIARIKFAESNQTIELDNVRKRYKLRSGVPRGISVWSPGDQDCTKTLRLYGLSDLRSLGPVVIAGEQAEEFTGKRSKTHRITVALARSLGCTMMRMTDSDYNGFGLPTRSLQVQAVSIQIGEPDPALFEVPKDYRQAP